MLNEKLDSLVRELNEESQAIVVPEGTSPAALPSPEAREGGKEGPFHPSPMPRIFKSKEQLMLRANSLKKALRQIIEQAERGEAGQDHPLRRERPPRRPPSGGVWALGKGQNGRRRSCWTRSPMAKSRIAPSAGPLSRPEHPPSISPDSQS